LDLYGELRTLYDACNAQFFANKLPPVMILLRPRRGTFGYFQKACWGHMPMSTESFINGQSVHAIALNSTLLPRAGEEEIVSTLVHEMCHLWQECFGERKPPKPYHNREWAAKMVSLGLMPSSTGQPGGKQLGKSISEYRLVGGLFSRWYDVQAKPLLSWGEVPQLVPAKQVPKRLKYVCLLCDQKAWADLGASLLCGHCRVPLILEAIQLPLELAEQEA
jgi:predicted SprT family Zn-dependent metalloprotease